MPVASFHNLKTNKRYTKRKVGQREKKIVLDLFGLDNYLLRKGRVTLGVTPTYGNEHVVTVVLYVVLAQPISLA